MTKLSQCLDCIQERQQNSGKLTDISSSSRSFMLRTPSRNTYKSGGTCILDIPKPLLVTKWVDYSNKYGFGAQLSDGGVTVRFNDCSKIALSADKR